MAIDDNTSYELTGAQVKDLANKIKGKAADNTFVGSTSAAPGSKGLVPQPQAGDGAKFLSGDGTWKDIPAGSSYTAGNGIDITNNVISADTNMIADGAVTAAKIDWATFKFPVPDYSNDTTISNSTNTWTAPKPGVISATLVADTTAGYKNVSIVVNGKVVAKTMWAGATGGYNSQTRAIVPVGTGDVVTFSAKDGNSEVVERVFYPYKWV